MDKRAFARRRVLKGGRITFNDGRSTIDCTVRDLSDGGAKLRVASVIGVPDHFRLVVTGGEIYECRVVHRKENELGVSFVSSDPAR
jgi:hypothetical protein